LTADYYIDTVVELTDIDKMNMKDTQAQNGFGASFYENKPSSNTQAGAYYSAGETIHSEISIGDSRISWLNGNLPFPKPDLNGKCNFFAGAGFMESGTTQCTAVIPNLKDTCANLLNPQFWVDNLRVMTGSDQVERQNIKIGEVYSL
jgi:hypothetical protein